MFAPAAKSASEGPFPFLVEEEAARARFEAGVDGVVAFLLGVVASSVGLRLRDVLALAGVVGSCLIRGVGAVFSAGDDAVAALEAARVVLAMTEIRRFVQCSRGNKRCDNLKRARRQGRSSSSIRD